MPENMLYSLSAVVALVPSVLLPLRRDHRPDFLYWMVLMVAVTGPLNWVLASMAGTWRTDLAMSLWVTVAASMGIFAVIAILAVSLQVLDGGLALGSLHSKRPCQTELHEINES